jgi:hypothetical protein
VGILDVAGAEEVVSIVEEEDWIIELLVLIIVGEVVGSVVEIVELEAIANCLKTSFRGRLDYRSRSATAGTLSWECFVFGKSVERALCLLVGGAGLEREKKVCEE